MRRAVLEAMPRAADRVREMVGPRSIVLVGMMGVGKTAVGRRLATALDIQFADSDREIETASRMSVADLFERYGEAEFRSLERRVIRRLLSSGPMVLATGGGAFINDETRLAIRETAISVWLRADLDILFERVSRRTHRPLLKADNPRAVLAKLLALREPVYRGADLTVRTHDQPLVAVVTRVLKALERCGRLSPAAETKNGCGHRVANFSIGRDST
jgi:shikimate kinase